MAETADLSTTLTRYHRVIREHLCVAQDQITDDAEFHTDLSADSLDMIELSMALEEEFDGISISDDDAAAVVTVKDGLDLVERLLAAQEVARG